jgi:hypothetical protein
MRGYRKQLYDAAVRLCAERPTDVDERHGIRCYADGRLIVTHYALSGVVTVETSEADSAILVMRVERGEVTRILHGTWEAWLLELGRNSWRAGVR